jgi:hypothetical protein
MTWDPTRPNGEVLSWQSSGQRTSFLYGNERAASMHATGLRSYEYNPLGDIIAGRTGTLESTGYAPYGKGETLNAIVEPRFGYRGEIQIVNRVHFLQRMDWRKPPRSRFLSKECRWGFSTSFVTSGSGSSIKTASKLVSLGHLCRVLPSVPQNHMGFAWSLGWRGIGDLRCFS